MNAVWLNVPEHVLAERTRQGLDNSDELWDGVLHMAPPPDLVNVEISFDLANALRAIGRRHDLLVFHDPAGLYDSDRNWRVPDCMLAPAARRTKRGLDGASLVVEVLSPNDESREKFSFYAKVGVLEIWLVQKTRAIEVYRLENDNYVRVDPIEGVTRSPLLDVAIDVIDGPRIRLRDGETTYEV